MFLTSKFLFTTAQVHVELHILCWIAYRKLR